MRVFVTGATGFVGAAVVQDLLAAGHSVLGMARSEAGLAAVAAAGATPHRGEVTDLDSLTRGVAEADGTIHTAFIHDFSRFKANCEIDRLAVEAMGAAVVGSGKPLVVTSGTALIGGGKLATEADAPSVSADIVPRVATEEAAAAAQAKGAKVIVMRLPPSVHGDGDHGFVPILYKLAREKGLAAYVGDGANRWPGVHRLDAARAYRLALEKGVAGRYHAAGEDGVPFRAIAEVIARLLGVKAASLSPEEAAQHFGWFHHFAGMDAPASSRFTRETLGWTPTRPDLLADIDRPAYFGG